MHILNAHISLYFNFFGGVRRGAKERVVSQLFPQTLHPVPSMPPRIPQGACRRPPGSPPRSPDKAYIKLCFTFLLLLFYSFFTIFYLVMRSWFLAPGSWSLFSNVQYMCGVVCGWFPGASGASSGGLPGGEGET